MALQLTVSDLRQYEYCARIPYFTHVFGMNRKRPVTYKMQEGGLEHEHVTELEERRSLRSYGLQTGERRFDVYLTSEHLGLTGRLDMLIVTENEAIPVEFKNDLYNRVGENHLLQLAAYSLIIEEQLELPVRRAFVHFIPTKQSREVPLSTPLKDKTHSRLSQLRRMIERESHPDATPVKGRCIDCEFRNFCLDVW
jgi:CRISPR-associated exonuclease Cas4